MTGTRTCDGCGEHRITPVAQMRLQVRDGPLTDLAFCMTCSMSFATWLVGQWNATLRARDVLAESLEDP